MLKLGKIEVLGTVNALTMSKKSTPGDGTHGKGVKGDHSISGS